MRFNEISEAKMGDNILMNPKLPPNLTIGFEAEVLVTKKDVLEYIKETGEDSSGIDADEIREKIVEEYSHLDFWQSLSSGDKMAYLYDMTPIHKITSQEDLEKYYEDSADDETKELRERIKKVYTDTPDLDELRVFYASLDTTLTRVERVISNEEPSTQEIKSALRHIIQHLHEKGVVINYEDGNYYFTWDGRYINFDDLNLNDYTDYDGDYLFDIYEESVSEFEDFINDNYVEYIDEKVQEAIEEVIEDTDPDQYYVSHCVASHLDTTYYKTIIDDYHGIDKEPDEYTIEPDSSINGYGAEIVSPVFDDYEEFLNELHMVLTTKAYSANSSTGLHIGIGTFKPDQIDLLKLAVFLGEDKVLADFSRTDNSYARSIQEYIYNLDKSIPSNFNKHIKDLNKILVERGDKYRTVNMGAMAKGYLEFRAMGGESYMNFNKVKQTIGRYLRAINIAMDPNAFRKEYLKKLYKLFDMGKVNKEVGKPYTKDHQRLEQFLKSLNRFSTDNTANSFEYFKWLLMNKLTRLSHQGNTENIKTPQFLYDTRKHLTLAKQILPASVDPSFKRFYPLEDFEKEMKDAGLEKLYNLIVQF